MGHTPVRMCAICRQRFSKAELSRYVLVGEGTMVHDAQKRYLGRGWYVCSQTACHERFVKYKPHLNTKKKPLGSSTSHADFEQAQGGKKA